MKKALSILILATGLLTSRAQAQTPVQENTENMLMRNNRHAVVYNDTLKNTDTTYFSFHSLFKYDLMFELTNTKLTGTVAGTATLKGTNDSVNGPWHVITGVTTMCTDCVGNGMVLSDGTVQGTWFVPGSPFNFYQGTCQTTGTATCVPKMTVHTKY